LDGNKLFYYHNVKFIPRFADDRQLSKRIGKTEKLNVIIFKQMLTNVNNNLGKVFITIP